MAVAQPITSESMSSIPEGLDEAGVLALYEMMVRLRRFELAGQKVNRAGELPGFLHLYIGEEATGSGVAAHLRTTDWITSTHRGHGHALVKGLSCRELMAELYGKETGVCGGRGGSMHLYKPAIGLFGTNGIVAGGIPSAVGAGISAKIRGTDGIGVAFFGDGGSSHGSFHESINFAGVQKAPVVFVCENNLYATATPFSMASANPDVGIRGAGYGIPGVIVDGNDVLAVWQVAKDAVERARGGEGPTLIESKTYRFVGHHEGDPVVGTYRTQEEIDEWLPRDPIPRFRTKLVDVFGVATEQELDEIDEKMQAEVDDAVDFARSSPLPDPATAHRYTWADPLNPHEALKQGPLPKKTAEKGWMEAVRDGLAEEMRKNPHIIYFGEGTGERGGSFGHTLGLFQEFGGDRMVDTPICELGFTGAAIGASATGVRAIADLMFNDLLFETGSQVPLQATKLRYMSNGQMSVPVILRTPCSPVRSTGPHHSGTYHSMWSNLPGIIVVMPSTPADAKGLMKTALRAADPVLFMEPKTLFRTRGEVPEGEYFIPFGQARVARDGTDITIVSAGLPMPQCLEAAEALAGEGISCEVIDLRTIVPMDVDTLIASLKKTGRMLVVDEGFYTCGLGAEVAQTMMENAFDELDAPIGRLQTDPANYPFSPGLEAATRVNPEKIADAAKQIIAGRAPQPPRATGVSAAAGSASAGTAAPAEAPAPQPTEEAAEDAESETAGIRAPSVDGEPVNVPHGDLTVDEVTVVSWRKQVGDDVAEGDPIVEVETDKASSEIEAPVAGKVAEILVDEGTRVKMGHQVATITPS